MSYGRRTQTDWDELRRAANRNLARLAADAAAGKPKPEVKKPKREAPTADDLETGQMVEEHLELLKLEARFSRREGKLTPDERAHWEEVDARLDVIREELKDIDEKERKRLKSQWRRYLKKGTRKIS